MAQIPENQQPPPTSVSQLVCTIAAAQLSTRRVVGRSVVVTRIAGLVSFVSYFFGAVSPTSAQGAPMITVQYVEVRREVGGIMSKVGRKVLLRFEGGGQIFDKEARSGRGRRARARSFQQVSNFGEEQHSGGQRRQQWRIGYNNTLIRAIDHPHHSEFITVHITGEACAAEVIYRLKPGFSTYMLTRRNGSVTKEFGAMSPSSVSCIVGR